MWGAPHGLLAAWYYPLRRTIQPCSAVLLSQDRPWAPPPPQMPPPVRCCRVASHGTMVHDSYSTPPCHSRQVCVCVFVRTEGAVCAVRAHGRHACQPVGVPGTDREADTASTCAVCLSLCLSGADTAQVQAGTGCTLCASTQGNVLCLGLRGNNPHAFTHSWQHRGEARALLGREGKQSSCIHPQLATQRRGTCFAWT